MVTQAFYPIDTKTFKEKGRLFRTKALFKEWAYNAESIVDESFVPPYTLQREHEAPHWSLYQLYMKVGDPTETKFVEQYMFSLKHWEALCSCPWFKPLIAEWRKELNSKLHTELVDILLEDAKSEISKTSTTSAKYLLDNYFRDKDVKKKITKTKVEDNEEKEIKKFFLEDAERIGIVASSDTTKAN